MRKPRCGPALRLRICGQGSCELWLKLFTWLESISPGTSMYESAKRFSKLAPYCVVMAPFSAGGCHESTSSGPEEERIDGFVPFRHVRMLLIGSSVSKWYFQA
jgi:hypothetical protein